MRPLTVSGCPSRKAEMAQRKLRMAWNTRRVNKKSHCQTFDIKNTSTTSLSPATTHFAHVHGVAIGMLFKIEWGRVCRYPTSRFATASRDFLEPNEHLFSGVNACRFDLTSVRLRPVGYGDHIRCGVRAPELCRCQIQEEVSQ